jgi:uncharacterized membrane protein YgcG
MSGGIWIIVAGLVAAFAVIALLAVSRSARQAPMDGATGSDNSIFFTPSTDFGSDSGSDSGSCDTGGADGGGSDGGGGGCD